MLLHRKVIRLDKGRKNIMISALREDNEMYQEGAIVSDNALVQDKYLIKLVLFENKRVDIVDPTRNEDGGQTE